MSDAPRIAESRKGPAACWKKWGGSFVIFTAVVLLGWWYVQGASLPDAGPTDAAAWPLEWTVPVVIVCLIGWFLYGFTNCFPREDWEQRTNGKGVAWERRNVMVIFSYVFTLIFLLFPLWGHLLIDGRLSLHESMKNIPIGILLGCAAPPIEDPAVNPPKQDLKSVPREIRCNVDADQWVVNIGGRVVNATDSSPPPNPPAKANPAALKKKPGDSKAEGKPTVSNDADDAPLTAVRIQGGLVIPLYFVILSLMGAAVSLARRVPEIQKQSEDNYAGTQNEPKLLPGEVRERLAFQIMQFISAPLTAVTAYHAIAPDTKIASVALGFTAGFASESILLMIRGVVDGIKPRAGMAQAAKGTASGVIVDKSNQPVPKAVVAVIGQPALKENADDHGLFAIDGIPVGEQVIEATLNNRTAKSKITIKAGKTSVCQIELG